MTKLSVSTLVLSALLLSSCIHKMDIPQGNIFSAEDVQKLHTGMTKEQVIAVMGSEPILLNTFNDNQMNYVYTLKPGGESMVEKSVILTFSHGRLSKIEK